MKVLYVTGGSQPASDALTRILGDAPSLEAHLYAGPAAALTELRTGREYDALLLDPAVPHNEQLALIAVVRRDRLPVAIVSVLTPEDRSFIGPVMTGGADDVLLVAGGEPIDLAPTLERIRLNRHVRRNGGAPRLRIVYVGQDDLDWDLIGDMPFVAAIRAIAAADGSCPLTIDQADAAQPAEAVVVDEHPGEAHPLEVIKWVRSHASGVRLIMLTTATGADVGGAAIDLGADDVVSKAGAYRRRLVSALHQVFRQRRREPAAATDVAASPTAPPAAANDWIAHAAAPEADAADAAAMAGRPSAADIAVEVDSALAAARETCERELAAREARLAAADARIAALTRDARVAAEDSERQRRRNEELGEAQAFERAMRERDREELARIRKALTDERERRIVLEDTLRATEDRAAADLAQIAAAHARARSALERQLGDAADRLHAVASDTQNLQSRLQQDLAAATAERERLVHSELFGYGVVRPSGELVRCNAVLARMLGFDTVEEALEAEAAVVRTRLTDHEYVVSYLTAGNRIPRVESVLTRAGGQPFRVLTSAVALEAGDEAGQIERVVIDLDDRTRLEEQLRLTRRLEAAGRLAAEMADMVERAVADLNNPATETSVRDSATALVEQLVFFARRQARPAGLIAPADLIRRAEPLLRQIAGDAVRLDLDLQDVPLAAVGEDDVEQLVSSLVHAAVGGLPYGGRVGLSTASVRNGFDQHTELSVSATGYGVQTLAISSFLARLVTRCGGTVRLADDPGRSSRLIVRLPR